MGEEEQTSVGVGEGEEVAEKEEEAETWNQRKQILILEISSKLIHGDLESKIEAARDIRNLVRKSSTSSSSSKTRSKLGAAGVIPPLVLMLCSPNPDARQVSLLALLNLAVRNER
nr:U-box domain-containing protein 14-like isoform X2 [Malus domestica]